MSINKSRTQGSQGDLAEHSSSTKSRKRKNKNTHTHQQTLTILSQEGQDSTLKSVSREKSQPKQSKKRDRSQNSKDNRKKQKKQKRQKKHKKQKKKQKSSQNAQSQKSKEQQNTKSNGQKQKPKTDNQIQNLQSNTKKTQKEPSEKGKPKKTSRKQKKISKSRTLKTTKRPPRVRKSKKEIKAGKQQRYDFKAMIYAEEQSQTLKQDDSQSISKLCPSVSETEGQVKQEFQQNGYQNDERMRQSQIAKRLHAYRDELQIMQIGGQSVISNQSLVKHQYDTPTDYQIEQLLKFLKDKYPERDQPTMVQMLYKCLIKKDSKGNDCRSIQQQLLKANSTTANEQYFKLVKNLQGNLRAMADRSQKAVTKNYTKSGKNEHPARQEDRYNFSEKQIVAQAFCNREYGMSPLLQEIRETGAKVVVEKNVYKPLITAAVIQAFRKLEDFLIYQCKRDIKPLNREEIRAIQTTLLSCRANFDNEQCLTFLKFMKLAFQLQSVTITDQAAMKLYIVIQRALKLKLGEMQLDRMYDTMRCNKQFKARRSFQNEKFQIHRVWTNQIESEFLNYYKQNQEFAKIRDYFKAKYIEHQHLYTIDSLRSRFNKIMRMALRKTTCFCQKFGQERVPHMIKLNDKKAKFLLKSPKGLKARLLLVDMYMHDECDIKRLYQTVSAVNEFVIMKDNERMNRMIEAEPLFNSAAAKINHNVTITKHKPKPQDNQPGQQLYFKGKEMNYDHIVQQTNGRNLHYYRKPTQSMHNPQHIKDIKIEEEMRTSVVSREPTLPSMGNRDNNYGWMESSCFSRQEQGGQQRMGEGQNVLEKMIRQQMQKYNKKAASIYSGYR